MDKKYTDLPSDIRDTLPRQDELIQDFIQQCNQYIPMVQLQGAKCHQQSLKWILDIMSDNDIHSGF